MEWVFVSVIAIIFSGFNALQVITQWLKNPPGYLFTGIAHYHGDYFLYVSQMAQGAAGRIFFYSHRFTNEPLPDTWIWWFNGLLGYLGHLAGLSPFATYDVALILLAIALIFIWYYLARLFYPKNGFARISFLLFMLTASSFFNIQKYFESRTIDVLGYFWFSPTQAFNRIGGVPHQMWQTILFILLAVTFTKTVDEINKKQHSQTEGDKKEVISKSNKIKLSDLSLIAYHLSLIILTLLASSANPIQMVVFLTTGAFITLSLMVVKRSISLKLLLPITLTGAFAFPAAWATNQAFNTPLFQFGKIWEASQIPYLTPVDFLFSLGPIILFIPFGLLVIRKRMTTLVAFFLSLTGISFIYFWSPIPRLLTTAPSRYLSPMIYIGLAILASDGISRLIYWSTHKTAKSQIGTIAATVVTTILLAVYPFFTLISLYDQIDYRANPNRYPVLVSYANHVPKTIVDTLLFLKKEPLNPRPVVVTEQDPDLHIETLIPVLADKITFSGHPVLTLYNDQKEAMVKQFFDAGTTAAEGKTFADNHRVGYVIAKNDATSTEKMSQYPFLTKIYENSLAVIYKIR